MCQKKPHPRCSSHALKRLETAQSKLVTAQASVQDVSIILKLSQSYDKALTEFFTSLKGIKQLEEALSNLHSNKADALLIKKAETELEYFSKRRAELIKAANKKSQSPEKICLNCKASLNKRQNKFCSVDCKLRFNRENHIKLCKVCKKTPQEVEFRSNPKTIDKLTSTCRGCENSKEKEYRNSMSPEKREYYLKRLKTNRATDSSKNAYLQRNFGITLDQFNKMLKLQENKCKICFKKFSDSLFTNVDHNHDTKKVRGILCRKCNLGIGHFKDNTDSLKSSLSYLEASKIENPKIEEIIFYEGEKRLDVRNMRHLKISKEGKERLLFSQDYKCKICQKSLQTPARYHIDHSHGNGHVRGILCNNCNIGVGHLEEDLDIIKSAIAYLG